MANVANPHKQFQFSIKMFGLNPFLAQKVTLPEREFDIIEHGDINHIVKTAGLPRYGILTVEKISSASLNDNWIWDWIFQIQDENWGSGDIPENYKTRVDIQKYATNGIRVVGNWSYIGVWPSKVNNIELSRVSSENTIESIEFQVDRLIKT